LRLKHWRARWRGPRSRGPNILFILADNFGYGNIGVCGGGELRGAPTPSREASESAGRESDAILKFLNSTILKSL
jgi:hypothetical protein